MRQRANVRVRLIVKNVTPNKVYIRLGLDAACSPVLNFQFCFSFASALFLTLFNIVTLVAHASILGLSVIHCWG